MGYDKMSFGINDLKVILCIFVVSEYQNSPLQLLENEKHNSDTYSRGNVLWFNIFSCQTIWNNSQQINNNISIAWTNLIERQQEEQIRKRKSYLVVEGSFIEWKLLYQSMVQGIVWHKVCMNESSPCQRMHILVHAFWLSRQEQRVLTLQHIL